MNQPVIIFDLGKVLVDFDYSIALKKLSARSARPPEDLHSHLGGSQLLVQYETGLVTTGAFFAEIQKTTGFLGDLREFGEFFSQIFSPIAPMIALHAELRQRGFKTFIFSNTNELAVEHIRRDFPFFAHFDGYVYSYEVKTMKPASPIYAAVEQMTGKGGGQIIYLDDRPENIEAGRARGWRTVLHESPAQTRAALQAFGVI